MSDQQRASTKVTLEDLLRLKRAERPPAEFWVDFERSLRAKQLAALVEKRPWWKTWSGFTRWSVPVGAAAALTITLVSFSDRSKPQTLSVAKQETVPVTIDTAPALAMTVDAPAMPADENIAAIPAVDRAVPAPVSSEESASPEARMAPAARLASVMEQLTGVESEGDADTVSPARFASVSTALPDGENRRFIFGETMLAEAARDQPPSRSSIEPLAQLSTPRDARRARLLAFTSSVDTRTPQYSNSTGVIRSRERIANHLNEDALYDSIRRLGVKDGGVSIQF